MTFFDLAKHRFSARGYLAKPIEKEKLNYILECGRVSPSAANLQPWHLIVATEPAFLAELSQVYPREWFSQSPAVLILCGDHQVSWKRKDGKDHCDVDIAIISDHMTLAATDCGLATCWICNFDKALCSRILHLPKHIEPIVILSLGYPDQPADPNRHTTKRKSLDEIVHWNGFNPPF